MSSFTGKAPQLGRLLALHKTQWAQQTSQLSTIPIGTSFKASDAQIRALPDAQRAPLPAWDNLLFGRETTDHMLKIHWSKGEGWKAPMIVPVENFSLHPYAKVLHYAQELFEGMKAFRGADNRIRLFRPDLNMERMRRSAERLCLPDFDGAQLISLLATLLRLDCAWIPPHGANATLYIRPTFMGTEGNIGISPATEAILYVIMGPTGPYFSDDQLKPVSLLADPKYVRAWPGGSGDVKLGANYVTTLLAQSEAAKAGHQQVLWLYGPDRQVTEVGTMNIFMLCKRESDGRLELATPPLKDRLILPGITRRSCLELVRNWGPEIDVVERVITMDEVERLIEGGRLLEMFGTGTACVVCPVGQIGYEGRILQIPEAKLALRLHKELSDIQYGRTEGHPWSVAL